ncbi:usg protein [Bosea sp. 117]|uniref:usg protein n=1 Tax=Bosea sp. 117 TaxID=1125973 RepID=UPI0004944174|nr:usg protein [Bosea sp. 117]
MTVQSVSASQDFVKQMAGYGLTTAHILYRMPDHPVLLQTYLWQHYDLCPDFPELNKFLEFWRRELDGPVHSVTVAHSRLIRPAELRPVGGMFRLN